MGKHDGHLPRKDLNKTVGHGDKQPAEPEVLKSLARGQGIRTKDDANRAKDNRSGGGK